MMSLQDIWSLLGLQGVDSSGEPGQAMWCVGDGGGAPRGMVGIATGGTKEPP